MSFIKNLGKTVQLVGKKSYSHVTDYTNLTYSVPLCLNRSIASEVKRVSNLQKYNRFLSTMNVNNTHATQETEIWSNIRGDLMTVYPDFVRDLIDTATYSDADISEWLEKVFKYNLPGGKMIRSQITVLSYKLLEKPENLTSENLYLANIMGWCTEMLMTYLCMLDDIIDRSPMRRNVASWYSLPGIGLHAINDTLLMQASMYNTLKKNFQDMSYYKNVLDVFNEANLMTTTGQFLDMSGGKGDKSDMSHFTMDRYNTIVKYKSFYGTLKITVQVAMLMCGIDLKNHHQANLVLIQISQHFQIQNDFLDCFGNRDETRKLSNDIEEGKCTWLSIIALQKANPAQKLLMEKYYGSKNSEHVAIIKDLYEKLAIPQEYAIYEETTYNLLRTQIQETIKGLPHELFFKILDLIFKRKI